MRWGARIDILARESLSTCVCERIFEQVNNFQGARHSFQNVFSPRTGFWSIRFGDGRLYIDSERHDRMEGSFGPPPCVCLCEHQTSHTSYVTRGIYEAWFKFELYVCGKNPVSASVFFFQFLTRWRAHPTCSRSSGFRSDDVSQELW